MAVVARGAIIRERVVSFLFSLHSVAVVGDHEGEGGIFLVLAALGSYSGPLCSTIFSSNSTSFSHTCELLRVYSRGDR